MILRFPENPTQLGLLALVNEALAFTLLVNDSPVSKVSPPGTEVGSDETLGSALHVDCFSSPLMGAQSQNPFVGVIKPSDMPWLSGFVLSTPSPHFSQVHTARWNSGLGALFSAVFLPEHQ